MRQQLEERLAALKAEYEKGQSQLRQLESQTSSLRETLLRISGAIMVLEELLSNSVAPASAGRHHPGESDADAQPAAATV
jgi:predicted nuclease with TOPRIM domain